MRRPPLVPVLLVALATLAPAAPAYAHAKLMSSSPSAGRTVASPATVTLNFDDPVQLVPASVRVNGPHGNAIAVRPAQPDPKTLQGSLPRKLADGRYTVRWRILADDGHIESGAFSFGVRAGAGRASAGAAMPANGPSSSPRGTGAAAVVLTLVLSLITIVALAVGFVRLRKERSVR